MLGLARAVRHEVYGLPLLPEYGRHEKASPGAQRDYQLQADLMEQCAPDPGPSPPCSAGSSAFTSAW
ncbi:hypothetical protein ACFSHR_27120 [Azotobacter chroococcum]